jgi:hypothetical protein
MLRPAEGTTIMTRSIPLFWACAAAGAVLASCAPPRDATVEKKEEPAQPEAVSQYEIPEQFEEKQGQFETRVYDIRDLVAPMPQYPADALLKPFGGNGEETAAAEATLMPPGSVSNILIIQVAPGSWGGEHGGVLEERDCRLVITHTPGAHRKIEAILAELRRKYQRQFAVDALVVSAEARPEKDRLTEQEMDKFLKDKKAAPAARLRVVCFNGQTAHAWQGKQFSYTAGPDENGAIKSETAWTGCLLEAHPTQRADGSSASMNIRLLHVPEADTRKAEIPAKDPAGTR